MMLIWSLKYYYPSEVRIFFLNVILINDESRTCFFFFQVLHTIVIEVDVKDSPKLTPSEIKSIVFFFFLNIIRVISTKQFIIIDFHSCFELVVIIIFIIYLLNDMSPDLYV